MLIGNRSVLNKGPGRAFGGSTVSDSRANWGKPGSVRGRYYGDAGLKFDHTGSTPNGYRPPYSWIIAQKNGGLSSYNQAAGSGSATGILAGGLNAVATLVGSGAISSATGGLIVSAVATIAGSGGFASNPELVGIFTALASLAASGNMTGAVGAIGQLVAALTAAGALTGTPTAKGVMAATITSATELSPSSLAEAIWSAANAIENGLNPREALRLIAAATAGKVSGAGTTTVTFRSAEADDKDRIVATVDASGNRTAITTDLTD